jgi:predicted Fe-S protein YdhL (DUF1289 family)
MNSLNVPVLSPCIGICFLDAHGYCEGCHRTGDEIAGWISYDDQQRRYIMEQLLPAREHLRAGQ